MPINQQLKVLFDADQADRISGHINFIEEKTIINPSRLTRGLEPLATPKPENKPKPPMCENCEEEHFGMCIKPKKPK